MIWNERRDTLGFAFFISSVIRLCRIFPLRDLGIRDTNLTPPLSFLHDVTLSVRMKIQTTANTLACFTDAVKRTHSYQCQEIDETPRTTISSRQRVRLPCTNSTISCSVTLNSDLRTIKAYGSSRVNGSANPIQHQPHQGCVRITPSSSAGATW